MVHSLSTFLKRTANKHICGMRVKCDIERGVTTVDQTKYIEKKAGQFGVTGDGHVYTSRLMISLLWLITSVLRWRGC